MPTSTKSLAGSRTSCKLPPIHAKHVGKHSSITGAASGVRTVRKRATPQRPEQKTVELETLTRARDEALRWALTKDHGYRAVETPDTYKGPPRTQLEADYRCSSRAVSDQYDAWERSSAFHAPKAATAPTWARYRGPTIIFDLKRRYTERWGFGIDLLSNGACVVARVSPGGLADSAGIQPGSEIVTCNNRLVGADKSSIEAFDRVCCYSQWLVLHLAPPLPPPPGRKKEMRVQHSLNEKKEYERKSPSVPPRRPSLGDAKPPPGVHHQQSPELAAKMAGVPECLRPTIRTLVCPTAVRPDALINLCSYFGTQSVDDARELLSRGIDVNYGAGERWTALHQCAHCVADTKSVELMRFLVKEGANVDVRSTKETGSQTALELAAAWHSVEKVRVLVDAGADVVLRDGRGRTFRERALGQQWRDSAVEPRVADAIVAMVVAAEAKQLARLATGDDEVPNRPCRERAGAYA